MVKDWAVDLEGMLAGVPELDVDCSQMAPTDYLGVLGKVEGFLKAEHFALPEKELQDLLHSAQHYLCVSRPDHELVRLRVRWLEGMGWRVQATFIKPAEGVQP